MINDKSKQPREYDLVLGGNNPPPTDGLVLGGIDGLKQQFDNAISEDKKISILKKAPNYGEAGEAWLFDLVATEKNKIQWLAAVLLSNTKNEVYKELLLEYFAEFIPNNIDSWNEYIQNNPNLSINLQGINCKDYIYLGRTVLRNINFGEANLKLAIFELSNLIQVDFSNSNLSQANFNDTILDCVKFDHAIFSGNYDGFKYTSFKNVSFINNNLTNMDFSTAKFDESSFDTCQLHNSHFDRSKFNRTIFRNSEAENIDFRFANLKGVKFDRVNLKGADFRWSDLTGVDFTGLDVSGANFTRCTFGNNNLDKANTEGAKFSSVDSPRFPPNGLGASELKGALFDDQHYYEPGYE